MLCRSRPEHQQACEQVHSRLQHRGERWRQSHRAGNERVIRARLSDAKFFYDTDLRMRLEDRLPKFEHIVFHEKLGTQAERISRIVALAGHLAPAVNADIALAERAAWLCKADLQTEVVGEFPEVQGLMAAITRKPRRGPGHRTCHRGSLQAEGAGRSGAV